jgi:hypothetical protein
MQTMRKLSARTWFKTCAALSGVFVLAASAGPGDAGFDPSKRNRTRMTINAGTVWKLDANFHHEVRGVVQVSNLGNCKVFFEVDPTPCASGDEHFLCIAGTMTITTLAGDKLYTAVAGWIDPDPDDPKEVPTMFKLHYNVTITGGTGELVGARGRGEINGIAMFAGPDGPEDTDPTDDRFCDGYTGVATWLYEGVLLLPPHKK